MAAWKRPYGTMEREQSEDQQQLLQRSSRRRKLSHPRVRFSEQAPIVHPLSTLEELQFAQEEIVTRWYSKDDIQQFLIERSNLAILLMNLEGSVPLVEDESAGLCLRGFEQFYSSAVRQQILARRVEHRTMVLMEQYRQLCDMGRRDASLIRACVQHISQPAVDEALLLAALDTRAISEDLTTCRLFFPVTPFGHHPPTMTTTNPYNTTANTTSTATTASLPTSLLFSLGDALMEVGQQLISPSLTTFDNKDVNDCKTREWVEESSSSQGSDVIGGGGGGSDSKLIPLSSLSMGNNSNDTPVLIPFPNEQQGNSISLRYYID